MRLFQSRSMPMNCYLKIDSVMEYIIPAGNNRKEEKPLKEERSFPQLPEHVTDMNFLNQFTGGNMEKTTEVHRYVS